MLLRRCVAEGLGSALLLATVVGSGIMGEHLAGGGLIVAAAHGPIGLAAAKELRLGGPL